MSKTKAQIQTELRSLRANLVNAHRLAAELRDRIGNLEAGMADRNGKITRLHAERDAALKERDYAKGQAEKAWAELDPERKKRDELQTELSYWKDQHNEVMGKLSAADKRIDELAAQRDTAETEREEYAGKLTEADAKLGEFDTKLAKAEHGLRYWKKLYEQEEDTARIKLTEAEAKLATSQAQYEQALEENNRLQHDLSDAQYSLADMRGKLTEAGAVKTFMAGKLVAADAELKSARDLLDARDVRARSAESRADYWELRAKEAERPWWCRVWDRVRRNGGAR